MTLAERSRSRAAGAAYRYACALLTVHVLFLPYGGYERMMEGKYHCFLLLTLVWLGEMCLVSPRVPAPLTPMRACAAAYFAFSALSALCSPYGSAALLGGTRRDGLLTLALYAAAFFLLSAFLRADRRLLYCAAVSAALSAALSLAQIAGGNPLRLYPAGLGYADGDAAYAGFYAGTSGNIDFTAFLLALATCVMLASMLRLRLWGLCVPLGLTLWALVRLGVAAVWAGLCFAAVWAPALLVPRRRRAMLVLSALLTLALLGFLWAYPGGEGTLWEASQLLHGRFDGAFGAGRLAIWRDCLALARERPLLGGGPDTLWLRGLEPLDWRRGGVTVPADVTAAHNEYLNILVNQGALALGAYLGLLGCAIAYCFRRAERARCAVCGAALLCYAAAAAFSISTPITAPCVWLLLAIVQKDEIDG